MEQHADERSAAEAATAPCPGGGGAAAAADLAHSRAPVAADVYGGVLDGSNGVAGAGALSPQPSLDLEELGGTSERLDDAMRRWVPYLCPTALKCYRRFVAESARSLYSYAVRVVLKFTW